MVGNTVKRASRINTLNLAMPGDRDNMNIHSSLLRVRKSPRRWWLCAGLLAAPFLGIGQDDLVVYDLSGRQVGEPMKFRRPLRLLSI